MRLKSNSKMGVFFGKQEGRIKTQNAEKEETFFEVKGGVVEVLKNKVLVLAE